MLDDLCRHKNTEDYYYSIRVVDRDKEKYSQLSPVERASRFLYLNKTCYNGLYRVNSKGEFNSPFGRYKKPNIVNGLGLIAVSHHLWMNDIELCCKDFEEVLSSLSEGSFVYLDPPYDPVSETANFTSYQKNGFNRHEQERLKSCCDNLTARGIKFMLSNSATSFIRELYKDYYIETVSAKRAINSKGNKRGVVEEVLVRNYGT